MLRDPCHEATGGFVGMSEERTRPSQQRTIQQMGRPPAKGAIARVCAEARDRDRHPVRQRGPERAKHRPGNRLISKGRMTEHIAGGTL